MGIEPELTDINTLLGQETTLLRCVFESIARFHDWEFEEQIAVSTDSHRFPIIGFDYGALFGGATAEGQGHCVVSYRVDSIQGRCALEVYDPGPRHAGFRFIEAQALYYACRKKHGGVWTLIGRG